MEGNIILGKGENTLSEQEEDKISMEEESKPEEYLDVVDMGKVDVGDKKEETSAKEVVEIKKGFEETRELKISGKNLSKPFDDYIKRFKEAVVEENKYASNPVYVDEIASKVAVVYEKVRKVIDWKEEHLLKRSAVERILKRRLVSKIYGINILPDINPEEIAEPFVQELIRSGYFPNGKIGREKIVDIQRLLEKYLYILKSEPVKAEDVSSGKSKKEIKAGAKKKINFYDWIIGIASCEVEEILDPPLREDALIDFMTECLCDRIKIVPDGKISNEEKYIQTYVAVHRTLYSLDEPIINFHLLRYKYPQFFKSNNYTQEFTENALKIWEEINGYLNHPKASEFYAVAEKYDAAYLMVGDSMNKLEKSLDTVDEKVSEPHIFLSLVEKSYKERLTTLKRRLLNLAIFSTLSIFVAGGASLIIFELPIAKLVHGRFYPWAIVADMGIPTALMFILVWMIKPPSDDNLDVVKDEVDKVSYVKEELDVYEIRLNKKMKKYLNFMFAFIYLTGGMASLYFIYWVFKIAGVPWTSLYVDTVNVAMVVFAAMVIRQRAKELTIKEKANIVEFILDFFSIPLAKIGAWFSQKWKEYNVVSAFFTALIDYPFSSFVATIEGWRNFIKEKKSEIH
ncbi:hypothetical protein GYA37_00210 [candidate division WWE3 bacterium]|uniref:Uncharacterized protein n=1 Tax=candidate division WWE3 bacterium TaxID=2053526 RepID=A0A7X9E6P1_UNCKA|nr:hypothetical protein [candidate division WWE3 bacterium]